MRKMIAVLLAVVTVFVLCGCTTAAERKAAEEREQQRLEAAKAGTLASLAPFMEGFGLTDYDITVDGLGHIKEIRCDAFEDLSAEDQFALLCSLLWSGSRNFDLNGSKVITTAGTYVLTTGFQGKATTSVLKKDGTALYSMLTGDANKRYTGYRSGGSGSSGGNRVTCSICNGTGKVRYYYGSSSTEAALAGKNDYEYGPCTSCGGKGYVYRAGSASASGSSGTVTCPSCGKQVSGLVSKKDAAGVTRRWCSGCWSDYNKIMG